MPPNVAAFHFACCPATGYQRRRLASLLCHLSYQRIIQIRLSRLHGSLSLSIPTLQTELQVAV